MNERFTKRESIVFLLLILLMIVPLRLCIVYFTGRGKSDSSTPVKIVNAPPSLGPRGRILDSRGNVLAVDSPTRTVCVDPSLVCSGHSQIALKVSEIFGLDLGEALKKITPRKVYLTQLGKSIEDRFEIIAHNVSPEKFDEFKTWISQFKPLDEWNSLSKRERLEWRRMQNKAFWALNTFRRTYPHSTYAGRVIGYTRPTLVNVNGIELRVEEGVFGIEKSWNNVLRGTIKPSIGHARILESGNNLRLTIDLEAQRITEEELAKACERFRALRGCAIVVKPNTGDILAMAQWPPFDPNNPSEGLNHELNMAISATFEPGSTMKAVTFAALLEYNLLDLNEPVNCYGGYWAFARLRDHNPYNILRGIEVLAKSSNIGTAILALERVDAYKLQELIYKFGFGRPTGIDLPGEIGGLFQVPKLEKKRYIDFTRAVIGYGISATPIQVLMAMSAIANNGTRMQPRIVSEILDDHGNVVVRIKPRIAETVISSRTASTLTAALQAVAQPGGTAPNAGLRYYTVAGKTGTAQKQDQSGRYRSGIYYSSFVGFFPATRPELCILVGIDEPDPRIGYYGSTVAAPVFKEIAERLAVYYRIPPDKEPEQLKPFESDHDLVLGKPLEGRFFEDQLIGLP